MSAPGSPLDDVDRRILGELQKAPRQTTSELARRVGMSPPAVSERVDRLQRSGVIVGWRLDIDPAAVGLPLSAFTRVRPGPGQIPRISELAASLSEVAECHRITGEDCFLIKLHVRSMDHLSEVLDRFALHGQVVTSIVVSTPVPPRGVALRTDTDS